MSINVILTSDKTEFTNYFPTGITLPARSNMALTKLSTTIPMFSQSILRVPNIKVADRGDTALVVTIDGIESSITWTNLFDAHMLYPGLLNIEPNLIATNYFSGFYNYFVNNNLTIKNAAGVSGNKPPLVWVISKAIDTAFEFYNCRMILNNSEHSISIPEAQTLNGVGGVAFNNSRIRCFTPNEYGMNVSYNCSRTLETTPTVSTFDAADVLNWTPGAGSLDSAATGINVAYNNSSFIDLNGGYMRVTPGVAVGSSGKTAWGFSLEGNGFSVDDNYYPKVYTTIDLVTPIIDIGIQFEEITVGADSIHLYKIIDGQEQYVHYNGGSHSVQNYSIYKPYDAVSRFTNQTDEFVILCRRGNIIGNSYEYIFDVLMGTGADISSYKIIYTSTKTLNQSAIQMVPVFLSTGEIGHSFQDINYVLQGIDTQLQADSIFNEDNGFIDTFRMSPGILPPFDPAIPTLQKNIRDFWAGIGLEFYNENYTLSSEVPYKISFDGTPLNKTILWNPSTKIRENSTQTIVNDTNNIEKVSSKNYQWFGKTKLSDFFIYFDLFNSWTVKETSYNINIPEYLDIHVLNHTISNFSGSYSGANFAIQSSGEDKIVAIVPVIHNGDESQDIKINYESFNPYYRPLSNPEAFNTNQFIIEVSYKDFYTNQRKTIDTIIGTLKMELNITKSVKQNIPKITQQNDLVPVI